MALQVADDFLSWQQCNFNRIVEKKKKKVVEKIMNFKNYMISSSRRASERSGGPQRPAEAFKSFFP
jgi:hypothetical protein